MDSTATIILAASLFIIMLGMGLSLTISDFQRIMVYPKAVITGLVNQIIFLPIIGWLIASSMSLPAEIAVGIMILAACPGGPTSNLITHIAKGDTALSVSLTAFSSLITIITIPLVVQMALTTFLNNSDIVSLNIPSIIVRLMVITIIPVSIGMLLKAKRSAFAQKMDKPVKVASAVVLALVIIGLVLKEKTNVIPYFQRAGLAALVLNIVTMAVGYVSGIFMRLSPKQALSISIESGIQNGTLAIAIATAILGNTQLAIAAAIYSLIMFMTAGFIVWYGTKTIKD